MWWWSSGWSRAPAAAANGTPLTIYTGRTESLVGPLLEEFSEENDVAIDVRYGDTNDLALLIGTEGDRSPADVYWGQSPGRDRLPGREGAARAAPGRTCAPWCSEEFADSDGRWVGTSGRQRVLVYNADEVAEADLPDSVFDLTGPAYRGKVGLAPTNGSFQDFITAMRDLEGEEVAAKWLKDMKANDAQTYANNNAIVEAVGRGEIPFGLVNHYYNHRFLAEDPSLPSRNHEFAAGDIGALVIPSTASVLAASDKPEEAAGVHRVPAVEGAPRSTSRRRPSSTRWPTACRPRRGSRRWRRWSPRRARTPSSSGTSRARAS